METKKVIDTNVEDASAFGYVVEDVAELSHYDFDEDEDIEKFIKKQNFRRLLIIAIRDHFRYLGDKIVEDLEDIWKRLDRIENAR